MTTTAGVVTVTVGAAVAAVVPVAPDVVPVFTAVVTAALFCAVATWAVETVVPVLVETAAATA